MQIFRIHMLALCDHKHKILHSLQIKKFPPQEVLQHRFHINHIEHSVALECFVTDCDIVFRVIYSLCYRIKRQFYLLYTYIYNINYLKIFYFSIAVKIIMF